MPLSPTLDDEFVNVWTTNGLGHGFPLPGHHGEKAPKDFYTEWYNHASAPTSVPEVIGADALRKIYPNHSLVLTEQLNPLSFQAAQSTPLKKDPLVTNVYFRAFARSSGIPGVLIDQVTFGSFKVTWKEFEFIQHTISFPVAYGTRVLNFILHDGPETVIRLFLSTIGAWQNALHEEIWVFDRGYWAKQHGLWTEVQKADWKDVILKDEFKKDLQKDVYGFFKSEAIYKELGIPWKRGLIMHGPPGNGKTISLKAIMKTCEAKGFLPLYVKSFQSFMGEEAAMTEVFNKSRSLSPCVVVLEDLDSLINDQNRSFFLNQLDGLESNDGLLLIGTTNHFDRLDPGLSTRPSRFDRKYLFDDPDKDERKLYAAYWQKKLANNDDIDFPDDLVEDFAGWTDRFSFAYLKEAFVSTLVLLAGIEENKPPFHKILKDQVNVLRKQLDKPGFSTTNDGRQRGYVESVSQVQNGRQRAPTPDRDIRSIMDELSEYIGKTDFGVGQANIYRPPSHASVPEITEGERRLRDLFDSLSRSIQQESHDYKAYTSAASVRPGVRRPEPNRIENYSHRIEDARTDFINEHGYDFSDRDQAPHPGIMLPTIPAIATADREGKSQTWL